MRNVILLIVLLYSGLTVAYQTAGKAQYEKAFYENTKSIISKVSGSTDIEEQAQKYTSCHMGAMEFYSLELQNTAFTVILGGGSFADAKMAFDTALATEGAAGGERLEKLQIMYTNAAGFGQKCLLQ